jgi:multidrug efflux pump subunit AcrA (membrane-fusion protein)
MKYNIFFAGLFLFFIAACNKKKEVFYASYKPITQSVYASGIVKGKNQYQVFAKVQGILDEIYLHEGDSVAKGQKILRISSVAAQLNQENAIAAASFNDDRKNQDRLEELAYSLDVLKEKRRNDSLLLLRQQNLFAQDVGSKIELEQKELNYRNSKANYESTLIKYQQLKRQIAFSGKQSQVNLALSNAQLNDLFVNSDINGVVYDILKKKGEMVTMQSPIAIVGDGKAFYLELQVDEFDIAGVQLGQQAFVSMDSHKGKAFEARVSKIHPIMNERTKTFLVEAEFTTMPTAIYPNLSAEANIVLQTKEKALLIPRSLLVNQKFVILENGETREVKVGLMDYEQVEILEGISESDALVKPE